MGVSSASYKMCLTKLLFKLTLLCFVKASLRNFNSISIVGVKNEEERKGHVYTFYRFFGLGDTILKN
jgi:hypothetical protein